MQTYYLKSPELSCIQTDDSKNPPPYTALSYTWGVNATYTNIEINRVKVPVRENLWDFLHQQLLRGNYGPFWIDALCIQQSEVHERNHQVRMMDHIYMDAQLVLIWLGKESDDGNLAMRTLTNWKWCNPSTVRYMFTSKNKFGNILLTRGTKGVTTWNPKEVLSVLSLCKKRYWSRMWIIQEVVHAKRVEIHWGSEVLEWYKFEQLYYYVSIISRDYKEMDTPFYNAVRSSPAMSVVKIKALDEATHVPGRPRDVTIEFLMETYSAHECEDIRDRVYAVVGIAKYGSMIVVDYRKSAKDVLLDVFYNVITEMSWEAKWREDELLRIGQLLEKVLKVPFPKTEIQFHIDRSRGLMAKGVRSDMSDGYMYFFGSVDWARTLRVTLQ
ncbi:hypothetical protein GT037_006675 [Alternaria burnsii]|uniref:Heterokaryon incompatibility domain-containing protein n=1 Tax=Alternaria burnsii TaxID=1187904 RepID=A0A8H7B0T7_9PLEO|nr:uncharacterized protein GT037_006675 [Alternaria burnsii]KAF7674912.1 hypothetical protein GT037_006675 [Alternaria burnsii]